MLFIMTKLPTMPKSSPGAVRRKMTNLPTCPTGSIHLSYWDHPAFYSFWIAHLAFSWFLEFGNGPYLEVSLCPLGSPFEYLHHLVSYPFSYGDTPHSQVVQMPLGNDHRVRILAAKSVPVRDLPSWLSEVLSSQTKKNNKRQIEEGRKEKTKTMDLRQQNHKKEKSVAFWYFIWFVCMWLSQVPYKNPFSYEKCWLITGYRLHCSCVDFWLTSWLLLTNHCPHCSCLWLFPGSS